MKITDPEIIKNGEKDLIDAVKEDIDLEAVRDILEKRLAASNLTADGGEIIVHNNQIAFRLDFSVQLSGSLMFDRRGNYISDTDSDQETLPAETAPEALDIDDIDIENALDEIGPESNGADDGDSDDFESAEELDIGLPDYSDDDAAEPRTDFPDGGNLLDDDLDESDTSESMEKESDALLSESLDPNTDLDLLDDIAPEQEITEDLLGNEQNSDVLDQLDDLVEESASLDEDIDSEAADDDINDILKESRDFWEKKEDS